MVGDTEVSLPPIFDDLDVGITLRNPETGVLLDGNERVEELYGYSIASLEEMDVEEFTAPSTKFTQTKAIDRIRSAAAGEPQDFEWQIERGSGELRWVRVHLNATTIDDTRCVIAEIEDITEYRTRERRLRLLSRIIRHNLRNKTTVLHGYADEVKRAVEDESVEDAVETILRISSEVGELSNSVKQIEQIAEPDATERSPTNLKPLVHSIVEDTRAEYPSTDLTVEASEDVWVIADKGLAYAVGQALSNAIEHNDQEPPSVTVSVSEDRTVNRGTVRIADNGPTIPENEIEVLREDVETSSTYHGTGVGLWVMQWCVDSLGGELRFEENTPRGNVVTISLPLSEAH